MRPLTLILPAMAVMGLAFWAYRENYATQKSLRDLAVMQDEIAALREEIAMQRAEWAYLNRPMRLKELATINFDRLQLLPLTPEQMAEAQSLAFPMPAGPATAIEAGKLIITGSANTSGEADSGLAFDANDKAFP